MKGSLTDLDGDKRRWRLRVYAGRTPDGKVLQRSRNFRGDKAAADAALRRFITEVQGGGKPGATFGQLVDAWWVQAERRRAPSTLMGYRRKLDKDVLPAFGRYKLERLTPAVLDRQYRQWEQEGLAAATVRQLHAIVSAVLTQGVKWGWLASSPAKRATPPSIYRPRRKAITVPELQALVRRAEERDGVGSVLVTAIGLGALTGARRGELCALRWSDWEGGGDQLHIARALTVLKGGKWVEGPTKTHQERTVLIDDVARHVLLGRLEAQRLYARSDVHPDAFILSRAKNGAEPCLPDGLSQEFGGVVEELWPRPRGEDGRFLEGPDGQVPAPRWHFHDLRHFVATVALAGGASARTVADRLGHRDVAMTLNVYAKSTDEASRDLAEFMGGVLAPKALHGGDV